MIQDAQESSGRKKPGNMRGKSDNRAAQERVELVAQMLAKGYDSRQVRRALQKAPHSLSPRQIGVYVTRARDWILQTATGITKQQAIGEAVTFYREVISNEKFDIKDRLDARRQLDLIFGVHAPRALAIREIPLPETPKDEAGRQFAPGLLFALELSYGKDETNQAIEVASRLEKDVTPATKKPVKQLKLA